MLARIASAFLTGLATPLGAVCVLPLYPGFIAYITNRLKGENKARLLLASAMIGLGVILFMFLLGITFTTIFKISLTKIIGIISPIAFGILAVISMMLLLDIDFARFIPLPEVPEAKHPLLEALLFGFFFGIIVVPCNPGFIALLFADVLSTPGGFVTSMLQFLAFGIGLSAPLMVLALISTPKSQAIVKAFARHKTVINRTVGAIMLAISLYYLIFVFKVLG